MIIEIRKAGFVNKGAELMLRAARARLKAAYPDAIFTMAPTTANGGQPFPKLVDAGFYPKASLYWKRIQWGGAAGILPKRIREMYGVILDREVDVVIDAAGFAYTDQWGVRMTRELAQSVDRWKRRGQKIILMPQAFGPFKDRHIRTYMARIVEGVNLIMPRERTSYEHLVDVVGERPHIRQYPDFTNLIEGVLPEGFDPERNRVCLVPNYRMLDKTDQARGAAYLPFMIRCARHLVGRGAKPFVLVHDGAKDLWLAERISDASGGIAIFREDDPLRIKGIIGASYATIGSRFHGLVSALSQGVPSLATGWSHKYTELFTDYGFPEGILLVDDSKEVIEAKIDTVIDDEIHSNLRSKLLKKSGSLKLLSEVMWREVFEVIDGT